MIIVNVGHKTTTKRLHSMSPELSLMLHYPQMLYIDNARVYYEMGIPED